MADHEVAEAMRLLSGLSRGDISPLLESKRILQSIFDRPAPEPADKRGEASKAKWDSLEAQVDRLLVAQMQNPIIATDPLPPKFEAIPVDPTPDREEAESEAESESDSESLDQFRPEPKYHWSPALWKRGATLFGGRHSEEAVQALTKDDGDGARGAAASETGAARNVPRSPRASASSAVPRTTGEDSAWESAAMAGLLDVNTLLKGDYKGYVSHVGCKALGSSLAGLQASIRNECFGEGTIPGAVASCGMDAVNLATTGDWARFGRRTSQNAAEGLGTWGGSAAAAWAVGGLGATVGLPVVLPIVGAFAARSTVRCLANMVPGMGSETKCESDTASEVTPQLKEAAGAVVEDMTQLQDALGSMKSALPEAFETFMGHLRTASPM